MRFGVAMRIVLLCSITASALVLASQAHAQDPLDQADPTQAEELEAEEPSPPAESTPQTRIEEREVDALATAGIYSVGPIALEGLTEMRVADFIDIIERYAARELTGEELGTLANEIATRARSQGYVFATASIEPQSLQAGVLRIRVDEGRIDRIRIDGDGDRAVRAQLRPLVGGKPVTRARLERQLLLAGDISGVWVRRAYFERDGDEGVLVVETRRQNANGAITFENDGSAPVGPERLRIEVDLNGLIAAADELEVTLATTPLEPDELQYGKLEYGSVINSSGTKVSMVGSYSQTDPGAYLADEEVAGESTRVGLEVRHPVIRSRKLSAWGEIEFQVRDLRQERGGVLARHDRIPVIRVGTYILGDTVGGRLRAKLTYSQGLDILGATELGDPLASRDDASAVFSSLYGWAEWERALWSDFSLELAARGQITNAPLLSTEDLGLGGNRFLRGYPYSQRSGDEGIMGSGELRYDWDDAMGFLDNVQVYAYADGGYVDNLAGGRGTGELYSAGGGFRTDITRGLDLDLEVAVPLSGPRYDTDDESPRFNVKLRKSL